MEGGIRLDPAARAYASVAHCSPFFVIDSPFPIATAPVGINPVVFVANPGGQDT